MGDPLADRKTTIKMYPISQMELNQIENPAEIKALLETRLIFGSYPEVITHMNNDLQKEYLHEPISSYLLKDILTFDGIKKSKKNHRSFNSCRFSDRQRGFS